MSFRLICRVKSPIRDPESCGFRGRRRWGMEVGRDGKEERQGVLSKYREWRIRSPEPCLRAEEGSKSWLGRRAGRALSCHLNHRAGSVTSSPNSFQGRR